MTINIEIHCIYLPLTTWRSKHRRYHREASGARSRPETLPWGLAPRNRSFLESDPPHSTITLFAIFTGGRLILSQLVNSSRLSSSDNTGRDISISGRLEEDFTTQILKCSPFSWNRRRRRNLLVSQRGKSWVINAVDNMLLVTNLYHFWR
ncbi:fatty acid desaturase 2 [Striga asiatica]|uniref:Fatty acid desaturase 2 n=1 Tax=Striga asiatica TaxID=4170 RepID=A0A5A7Q4G2_STRAF|nr:fatty acid desaturase 2 [Striga asiatica]